MIRRPWPHFKGHLSIIFNTRVWPLIFSGLLNIIPPPPLSPPSPPHHHHPLIRKIWSDMEGRKWLIDCQFLAILMCLAFTAHFVSFYIQFLHFVSWYNFCTDKSPLETVIRADDRPNLLYFPFVARNLQKNCYIILLLANKIEVGDPISLRQKKVFPSVVMLCIQQDIPKWTLSPKSNNKKWSLTPSN